MPDIEVYTRYCITKQTISNTFRRYLRYRVYKTTISYTFLPISCFAYYDIEYLYTISYKKPTISGPILEVAPKRRSLAPYIGPDIEYFYTISNKKPTISCKKSLHGYRYRRFLFDIGYDIEDNTGIYWCRVKCRMKFHTISKTTPAYIDVGSNVVWNFIGRRVRYRAYRYRAYPPDSGWQCLTTWLRSFNLKFKLITCCRPKWKWLSPSPGKVLCLLLAVCYSGHRAAR